MFVCMRLLKKKDKRERGTERELHSVVLELQPTSSKLAGRTKTLHGPGVAHGTVVADPCLKEKDKYYFV